MSEFGDCWIRRLLRRQDRKAWRSPISTIGRYSKTEVSYDHIHFLGSFRRYSARYITSELTKVGKDLVSDNFIDGEI